MLSALPTLTAKRPRGMHVNSRTDFTGSLEFVLLEFLPHLGWNGDHVHAAVCVG